MRVRVSVCRSRQHICCSRMAVVRVVGTYAATSDARGRRWPSWLRPARQPWPAPYCRHQCDFPRQPPPDNAHAERAPHTRAAAPRQRSACLTATAGHPCSHTSCPMRHRRIGPVAAGAAVLLRRPVRPGGRETPPAVPLGGYGACAVRQVRGRAWQPPMTALCASHWTLTGLERCVMSR